MNNIKFINNKIYIIVYNKNIILFNNLIEYKKWLITL